MQLPRHRRVSPPSVAAAAAAPTYTSDDRTNTTEPARARRLSLSLSPSRRACVRAGREARSRSPGNSESRRGIWFGFLFISAGPRGICHRHRFFFSSFSFSRKLLKPLPLLQGKKRGGAAAAARSRERLPGCRGGGGGGDPAGECSGGASASRRLMVLSDAPLYPSNTHLLHWILRFIDIAQVSLELEFPVIH